MNKKIAQYISIIFFPYIIAFFSILLVLYSSVAKLSDIWYWALICLTFVVVIPFLYVGISIYRNKISDHEVNIWEHRKGIYIVGCCSLLFGLFIMGYLSAPLNLFYSMISVIVCGFFAALLNKFFKISVHMVAMGLAMGILLMHTNLEFESVLFFIGCILVAWSRLVLNKHTLFEVITGFVLSLFSILIVNQFFPFNFIVR